MTKVYVDSGAFCPALLQAPWSRRIYGSRLCLLSLLAAFVELLLSTQVTCVTSWGTGLSPCALQGAEGPDPDPGVPPGSWPHTVRYVGLSWVPEATG